MSPLTPTAVWRISPELVLALDQRLGPPVDSYLNGSQTWLEADGPRGMVLEYRLHPVAGFRLPTGLSHYELWEAVVGALAAGVDPRSLPLGDDGRPLDSLWDGLECFPAYGPDEGEAAVEPAVLATGATDVLGIGPEAAGLVDHEALGDAWERARGGVSILDLLFNQLLA